jgi:Fe/S biogenesis protein NfuA
MALAKVRRVRAYEESTADMALWVEVGGVERGQFTYRLGFAPLDDAGPDDEVQRFGDVAVVVPAASTAALDGARLDLQGDLEWGGLQIENPNLPAPPAPPRPSGDPAGDLAQRALAVLEREINPAVAMHGGRVELVAVEGPVAYVRMLGGCQGCGMASVTLGQGVEVALRRSVPGIVQVVDVTDHAAGTNPYYEPAKK